MASRTALPDVLPIAKKNRRVFERHQHPNYPRLYVELQSKSKFWQARIYLNGRPLQHSLKPATELTMALRLAEEWYRKVLRAEEKPEHPVHTVTATVAQRFAAFRASLSKQSQRDDADMRWAPIADFWRSVRLDEVTSKTWLEFYGWRRKRGDQNVWRRQRKHADISNHTLQKDVALITNVLNYSRDQGLLTVVPNVPKFGDIAARPRYWLRRDQWQDLMSRSEQRIRNIKNRKTKRDWQYCHDFMLWMVDSMMRVDETQWIQFDQCWLNRNSQGDEIVICDVVKSKKGPRSGVVCGPQAAAVYKRRRAEWDGQDPRIFPSDCNTSFKNLLKSAGLYFTEPTKDPKKARNLKSLRATAISFQILNGVNVVIVANNSGTGIQSIQNFYTKHLRGKDAIDMLTGADLQWREYRDFEAACEFAKSLGLKTVAQWKGFVMGGQKPADIPGDPATAYRDYGWRSWQHWLGLPGPDIELESTSNVVVSWGTEHASPSLILNPTAAPKPEA